METRPSSWRESIARLLVAWKAERINGQDVALEGLDFVKRRMPSSADVCPIRCCW
jgi:hypothetical protein